ncbi:FlgB family protein [Sedimentitalea nanhaiensis]|uniref:Flagellar basal-body rod protein FlgB n=1 Tax=Sedimentitalea nanhaiensis TaxID=999627 RepID=A0A1I7C861_9RHOB|nr:FlgB family protein [Sedimentitalea nanhaiensis]SFT95631.1 flagellar basal-body rod protein FlgB [Sedimentitalea nanhaiensis]
MFQGLNVFKTAHAMATHAGQRQAIVAQNVANADTPDYKARDIKPFAEVFQGDASAGMRASRAGHLGGAAVSGGAWQTFTSEEQTDPNGNSVSVELELLKGVEIKRQHDRALAIYKSSLSILRTSLGRG